jgi:phage major head subunit gpT-like protein
VFPRLSSTDKFYLLRTDVEVRSFIFQDREALEFTALAQGSEEAFKREKYLYGVRARYAMAYGYWQYCAGTQFV